MPEFKLVSAYSPKGDQPGAIAKLVAGLESAAAKQVLLGVTGSGKTFTMAEVIARTGRPALILAHNKTLAAQLFSEFKHFFPENAVEYFVSYYDYYQPEAYVPQSDTYIEKESTINEEIDKLRNRATRSLLERRDVIIVASVSCIYGIGSPDTYANMRVPLKIGDTMPRTQLLRRLVDNQYERTPLDLGRGQFRVRGDTVEIRPASEDQTVRIELFGDEIEAISMVDPVTGRASESLKDYTIYPNSHYATPKEKTMKAIETIKAELKDRLAVLNGSNKLLEAQRLEQRTLFDLEMLAEVGYCSGIENYSRHFTGAEVGEPPPTLLDYLPADALMFIDESHATVPQLKAMYNGDQARKKTLVEFGFRLPSALDNRPLKFEEFWHRVRQTIFVSATPSKLEIEWAGGTPGLPPEKQTGFIADQVIRPTGLMDPPITIRPVKGQVDDLLGEVRLCSEKNQRVLITTLTKKMAEELSVYFRENDVKAEYLHSDVETLERVAILRELRQGVHDCLIGVNLLREGLDLPEVALVAVLDADKEGFLRSETSLIQTSGRAARNLEGRVIFYADTITRSMQAALNETDRRRLKQDAYNKLHGITPASVKRDLEELLQSVYEQDYLDLEKVAEGLGSYKTPAEIEKEIIALTKEMLGFAEKLEFEKAGSVRERIARLRQAELGV